MKRLYEQGITLIALVVTIIILLILAGVTIGMATSGTGLFEKAKEATKKYQNAQEEEEMWIAEYSNGIDNYASLSSSRAPLPTVILYPDNGESKGSEASPATINKANRVEIDNPYPGHNVYARAEIRYDGVWGSTPFINGCGVYASQYRNATIDKIVIQAGYIGVLSQNANVNGGPFGDLTTSQIDSCPFRLVVVCLD